jgi:hypothetical protein
MAVLRSLAASCGTMYPPGLKTRLSYILRDDIQSYPRTKEEMGGTDQGDSMTFGEEFTLKSGKSWKTIDILVNTGGVSDILEGEVGGQGFVSRLNFFVLGDGAAEREFAQCFFENTGCLIFQVGTKSGHTLVLGELDNALFVEVLEGNTGAQVGDRVGFNYTAFTKTGHPARILPEEFSYVNLTYDGNTLTFDGNQIDYGPI